MNSAKDSPQRLDQYVAGQLPNLSRASAAKLIPWGKVRVNGRVILKAGHKLHQGDAVLVDSGAGKSAQVPNIKLPILYEDDSCVVINKPAGILSHSKGTFNPEATVATWLGSRAKDMNGERAGIVHRLDRATSGVMICAKKPEAMSWLQKQFSSRKVKKTYIAVTEGSFNQPSAIINMPIERNPKKPQTFRAGVNGKPATTAYKVVKSNQRLSMVRLMPTTGRTHQLRVHLSQLGHPILGDTLYGGAKAERLLLHAHRLEITLPNRQRKTFTAPLPPIFNRTMRQP